MIYRPVELAPLATNVSRYSHVNKLIYNNRFNNISIPQPRTDLDNRTHTYIVSRNTLITHYHETNGQPTYVNVVAYDPTLGSVPDIRIVNVAVAYDYPKTEEMIVFKTNQAIHIKSMAHFL